MAPVIISSTSQKADSFRGRYQLGLHLEGIEAASDAAKSNLRIST
jgi:hypothetical protein